MSGVLGSKAVQQDNTHLNDSNKIKIKNKEYSIVYFNTHGL